MVHIISAAIHTIAVTINTIDINQPQRLNPKILFCFVVLFHLIWYNFIEKNKGNSSNLT